MKTVTVIKIALGLLVVAAVGRPLRAVDYQIMLPVNTYLRPGDTITTPGAETIQQARDGVGGYYTFGTRSCYRLSMGPLGELAVTVCQQQHNWVTCGDCDKDQSNHWEDWPVPTGFSPLWRNGFTMSYDWSQFKPGQAIPTISLYTLPGGSFRIGDTTNSLYSYHDPAKREVCFALLITGDVALIDPQRTQIINPLVTLNNHK